ncbi:hypothetical protein [Allobranchiibius sp. GilTou73]|uniref:hypothetical protein n=1 Tax=Allobranchiibius sp. GilTou73 TaxID=2904523 RepID=UPI001F40B72F|nr:hypothetical protein [Allobranchiibius sp. GilTou73]UIJ36014.1 hypothetical protein LVQ62_06465 [Allobranchiibius sp. GilTou73]
MTTTYDAWVSRPMDIAIVWIVVAQPGASCSMQLRIDGTPDTVEAIEAARASYSLSRWPRSTCANSTKPTPMVAARMTS